MDGVPMGRPCPWQRSRRRRPPVLLRMLLVGAAIVLVVEGVPGQTVDAERGARIDPAAGRPTVVIPETPAGRRLAAWADAFNTGERETLARFLAEQTARGSLLAKMPARDRIDSAMFLRSATGGV